MSRKRRTYSAEFKFETVVEGLRGEKTVAQICRERDITESLYYSGAMPFWSVAQVYLQISAAASTMSRPNG